MVSVKQMFQDAIGKLILRDVTVASTHDLGRQLRRIDVVGDALRGVDCDPGDKVQLWLDGNMRTYTPFAFDAARGAFSVVAFAHGEGTPGARFAKDMQVGAHVGVFGPRSSLPLRALRGPVVLVGDETSLGVARALHEARGAFPLVLEATDEAAVKGALEHLELRADVVQKRGDDGHLSQVEEHMRRALRDDVTLVLTGRAATTQALRQALRARPAKHAGQKVKAYWATGKKGLD